MTLDRNAVCQKLWDRPSLVQHDRDDRYKADGLKLLIYEESSPHRSTGLWHWQWLDARGSAHTVGKSPKFSNDPVQDLQRAQDPKRLILYDLITQSLERWLIEEQQPDQRWSFGGFQYPALSSEQRRLSPPQALIQAWAYFCTHFVLQKDDKNPYWLYWKMIVVDLPTTHHERLTRLQHLASFETLTAFLEAVGLDTT